MVFRLDPESSSWVALTAVAAASMIHSADVTPFRPNHEVPEMSVRTVLLSIMLLAGTLAAQSDVQKLIRKLHNERDDAELALVEQIGKARTREAAEGLIKGYDRCVTLLFRRQIVKTLGWFANLADSQQPALDKLAEIAGMTEEAELRLLALKGLGESRTVGKQLLRGILDSQASDDIREPAMQAFVRLVAAADEDWLRLVWNLEKKQRKDKNGDIMPPEHNPIRLLAFGALLPFMREADLVLTLKREADPKIRRRALEWMAKQRMSKTDAMATMVLQRVMFQGPERCVAAGLIAESKGTKAFSTFVKLAKKGEVTQEDLRIEMARIISTWTDAKTQKRAVALLGKGQSHQKVFALRATIKIKSDKVLKLVRKGLKDKDINVRRAAAESLAIRLDEDSVPWLRVMLEKPKVPEDIRIALEAINQIKGPMSKWLREIAGYATHEDRDVRNAAVAVLAEAREKRHLPALMTALEHEDWSTRFLAITGIAKLRKETPVAKLIERMAIEKGRMKKHMADALWQLTAQSFGEDEQKWAAWWKVAKSEFKVASEKERDKAEVAREKRRLTQRTVSKAKFFGIKVESHRVLFILDVSGSMMESMYGREINGRGAARIDIAKKELAQAVKNLDPGALFNIYAFSNGVARWDPKGIGANSSTARQEALTWIERLGASGGTNLYDAVREGFEDKDVDTIFILSDGEPTVGDEIDPFRIREDVAKWNKYRKIKINTIAIGGNLEVLEWLAKDAGGTYRQMR